MSIGHDHKPLYLSNFLLDRINRYKLYTRHLFLNLLKLLQGSLAEIRWEHLIEDIVNSTSGPRLISHRIFVEEGSLLPDFGRC